MSCSILERVILESGCFVKVKVDVEKKDEGTGKGLLL